MNLANERDPVAELLIEDLEKEIKNDKSIQNYLQLPFENQDNIIIHLQKKYFTGFCPSVYLLKAFKIKPGKAFE